MRFLRATSPHRQALQKTGFSLRDAKAKLTPDAHHK
jgi:hypothetical protein